jgi:exopolyphosphatase/guanosine-5'-triphosphate,3'-diphosphate pyrophosphatase
MSWRSTRASGQEADGKGPHRVAIADLGSNSWRLVVFSYGEGPWWKRTDELYETVRIGAGMAATGSLSDAAMERGLETLDVFSRFCRAGRIAPEDVHVVATSAIRDAENGEAFLARVHDDTGLGVEILDAHDEAYYGYIAAVNSTTLRDGAVLEIGGGSMQLIRVEDRRAEEMASFPLGAVRLTELLLGEEDPTKPAKRKHLARVRQYAREMINEDATWLTGLGGDGTPPTRLVGLGGAVRNLAAAAAIADGVVDLGVQGYVLSAERLAELVTMLAEMPATERGTVPGIKPGRGDIILAAALVIETVVQEGGFSGIEVTEAGLREGVFLARTLLDPADPLIDDVREAAVNNLAVQYESDLPHVRHVALLATQMFDSLVSGGLFEPRPDERELLWAAAMLHDVGMTISYDDHHKHSRYLIESAELPGFDPRERALIAQMTRYHRKGVPKLGAIASLTYPEDEALLDRCATVLRLAEHLERGRDRSVSEVALRVGGDESDGVEIHLEAAGDLTLPRWSVERYGDDEAFERVFGRRLLIG